MPINLRSLPGQLNFNPQNSNKPIGGWIKPADTSKMQTPNDGPVKISYERLKRQMRYSKKIMEEAAKTKAAKDAKK